MTSHWRTEFAGSYNIPPELEALLLERGFVDSSWHNDISPSFLFTRVDGSMLRLWIDHELAEEREYPDVPRFQLESTSGNDLDYMMDFATEDLTEAMTMIRALQLGPKKEEE